MLFERYVKILRPRMSERRLIHSINVAKEACRLAQMYGADPEKAQLAGILHDITKETPFDEQLQIINSFGIILSDVQLSSPKLWHGISGSVYINRELEIYDKDVLNAVRYHTTGRKGMSLLEKVIFVADFTGAERDYNGVEIMREKSNRSLEEAIMFGVSFSISDLLSRSMTIDENTVSLYNEIVMKKTELYEVKK